MPESRATRGKFKSEPSFSRGESRLYMESSTHLLVLSGSPASAMRGKWYDDSLSADCSRFPTNASVFSISQFPWLLFNFEILKGKRSLGLSLEGIYLSTLFSLVRLACQLSHALSSSMDWHSPSKTAITRTGTESISQHIFPIIFENISTFTRIFDDLGNGRTTASLTSFGCLW